MPANWYLQIYSQTIVMCKVGLIKKIVEWQLISSIPYPYSENIAKCIKIKWF